MKWLLVALFIGLILVSGCIGEPKAKEPTDAEQALDACVELCKASELDLETSPCLSNDLLNNNVWVCDVAHSPRQDIDNLAENQCEAWRNGTASHFVELDPECNLIKLQ